MTKTDRAYIAGFLDGEGCITVNQGRRIFRPLLTVSNTKKEPLQYIANIFGGNVKPVSARGANRKPQFRLNYYSVKAKRIIKAVLPYLIVKRKVAELVLNFPRRHAISLGKGQGTECNTKGYNAQLKVVRQIRKLNKRGVL